MLRPRLRGQTKRSVGKSVGKKRPHVSRIQPYEHSISHGNSGSASTAPIYNADIFVLSFILPTLLMADQGQPLTPSSKV